MISIFAGLPGATTRISLLERSIPKLSRPTKVNLFSPAASFTATKSNACTPVFCHFVRSPMRSVPSTRPLTINSRDRSALAFTRTLCICFGTVCPSTRSTNPGVASNDFIKSSNDSRIGAWSTSDAGDGSDRRCSCSVLNDPERN